MVKKSRFGYRTPVPSSTTRKAQTKSISFKDGIDSFKDNDDVKITEVVSAVDARFSKIGRYRTRKGLDRYSVPVGEAVNVQQASTTGASTWPLSGTSAIVYRRTTASGGRISRVDVNIKAGAGARGTVLVEVWSEAGNNRPAVLLCRSSIPASAISSTLAYVPVYFVAAPLVTSSQQVWVVITGQNSSVAGYEISTTTTSPDTFTRAGDTYTSVNYSPNVKIYTATDAPVKGLIRAYRPNGQKLTMFAHGTTIASVNDGTGATTALKSDFSASATAYRSKMVQDATYWVNGYEKPWKYDFTTWTQLTNAPYIPSLIEEHKGLLFFNDVNDKTRIFYSNFADYETYTSTDFIYVPAPKSFDALTAFAKLNGVLFLFANRNKFQLYGSDNDTFNLDEAASQRGTFTQETCVYDANFIYHADDEGIWQFDGSSEKNLALPFLDEYQAIPNKSTMRLDLYNNRLYCFYTPEGGDVNSECFVMNLLLDVHESKDMGTYIGRTFGRDAQEDIFIQASNRVAALYYGELESNDHTNLGDQLQFEVKTNYSHFDRPGEEKRIPKWRPQFPSESGDYSVQAGYDLDMLNQPTFSDVSVRGSGIRYDTGAHYDTGEVFGGSRMVTPLNLFIPGRFRRVQRIYKHVAAREPVEVDSEVISIEIQRLL